MGKIVVTEFSSLDGVVEDPGGAEPENQAGMERRPAEPVEPRRDGTADRLLRPLGDGCHPEPRSP